MARDFPGVPFASLPEPTAPDFTFRLRNMLATIHHWASDQSGAMARISVGQVPDGSGGTPGGTIGVTDHGLLSGLGDDDHSQYLNLSGRSTGQTLTSNAAGAVTFTMTPLSGQTSNLLEWKNTSGTTVSSVLPTGVMSAGQATPSTTSPTGAAVLNATGISGAANGLRATAFGSGDIAVHAIGALSATYALRVALGATNPDAAGIMADGRAAFGALPETNCAILAKSLATTGVVTKVRGLASQTANLTEWQDSAGGALASMSATGGLTCTGSSTFLESTGTLPSLTCHVSAGAAVDGLGLLLDDGSGFKGAIQAPAGGFTADRWYGLPDGSGILLVAGTTAALSGTTASVFQSSSSSVGAAFADITTSTKKLRFVLSGAVGNNAITVSSTAARVYTLPDTAGRMTLVGNAAASSGVLGTIALTGQTASLAAQTLLTGNTVTAGAYRISLYLTTTTIGDVADNVTLTLAWNDGAAQTMVVGFLGTTSNILPYTAHDLRTANAFSEATVVVRVAASTNITFTTTLTSPGAGTPAYSVDARIESLG